MHHVFVQLTRSYVHVLAALIHLSVMNLTQHQNGQEAIKVMFYSPDVLVNFSALRFTTEHLF